MLSIHYSRYVSTVYQITDIYSKKEPSCLLEFSFCMHFKIASLQIILTMNRNILVSLDRVSGVYAAGEVVSGFVYLNFENEQGELNNCSIEIRYNK